MPNITVIDALMGSGKTQYIYSLMRKAPKDRYIYIGVNLAEASKARSAVPALAFKDPVLRHGRKYFDLERLINEGENIATTHQLFSLLTVPLYEKLRDLGYVLVIDEALDVVSRYKDLKASDWKILTDLGCLFIDKDYCLRWDHERFPRYDGKHNQLVALCDNGNLVSTRDKIIMWQFPAQFLSAFKHVYIATYMFEGQIMADYLKANKTAYRLTTLKDRELVDYSTVDNQPEKEKLGALIYVDIDPHRNSVGNRIGKGWPLSKGWFKSATGKNANAEQREDMKRLKNATARFFKDAAKLRQAATCGLRSRPTNRNSRDRGTLRGSFRSTPRLRMSFRTRKP